MQIKAHELIKVSVNKPTCPHCGRKNPSLWGYSRSLRRLGSGTAAVVFGDYLSCTYGTQHPSVYHPRSGSVLLGPRLRLGAESR